MELLKIENVTKKYSNADTYAVGNCSFSINKGDFISIEGVSGSGKSTLLMMIGGLLKPSNGHIIYDGKDIYGMNDKALSQWRGKAAGYLFQNVQLVQALTIRENMLLARKLGNNSNFDIDAILKELGLENEADRLPGNLSGGQKRRAMIGCVLSRDSEILLADEPTNDLDEHWATIIMDMLKKSTENGKAVVLVTHDKRWSSLATTRYSINSGVLNGI